MSAPRPVSAPRRRSNGSLLLGGLVLGAITAAAAFPTFLILSFGLTPALAALFVDRSEERTTFNCVLAANLCGIVPVLADLWSYGNTIEVAIATLGNVFAWFKMYGAAALGWVLLSVCPSVTRSMLAASARRRVRRLRAEQAALKREWGRAVTGEAED